MVLLEMPFRPDLQSMQKRIHRDRVVAIDLRDAPTGLVARKATDPGRLSRRRTMTTSSYYNILIIVSYMTVSLFFGIEPGIETVPISAK